MVKSEQQLPIFQPGQTIVVEERWKQLLWSAVPQRVVESAAALLVCWVPAGTIAVRATNRGLPQAEGLTRDQRKLLALKTCEAVAREFPEAPEKLIIYRPGRWSTINLGWDPHDGRFLGWYVDFQSPVTAIADGLVSKDLVLDIWVDADRNWQWKDREDFTSAVADGILSADLPTKLDHEAQLIIDELESRAFPFTAELTGFRPDRDWDRPALPPSHRWRGPAWSLPAG